MTDAGARLGPEGAVRVLMTGAFTPGQLAAVRERVAGYATSAGLTGDSRSDFVVAVNEALTNVVRHGGGSGTLRLWRDGELVCEICDDGPGFDATPWSTDGTVPPRPVASGNGGMGLWLVRRLSPGSKISSGPNGTRIRIVAPLPH